MAHIMEKWSDEGKGMEKWRKILMIAEGNVITMFMNLRPLAKGRHGVKRRSPQAVGRSQKEDMSSSLDTVLRRSQLG